MCPGLQNKSISYRDVVQIFEEHCLIHILLAAFAVVKLLPTLNSSTVVQSYYTLFGVYNVSNMCYPVSLLIFTGTLGKQILFLSSVYRQTEAQKLNGWPKKGHEPVSGRTMIWVSWDPESSVSCRSVSDPLRPAKCTLAWSGGECRLSLLLAAHVSKLLQPLPFQSVFRCQQVWSQCCFQPSGKMVLILSGGCLGKNLQG